MSTLVLVRHGQASFFSDDYDKLSDLGMEQSRILGRYWVEHGVRFDEVYCGSLLRQRETAECAGEAFKNAGLEWPEHQIIETLNEYPGDEVMGILLPELCENFPEIKVMDEAYKNSVDATDKYKTFHRLLEAVMDKWVHMEYESEEVTTWEEFSGGLRDALQTIMARNQASGRRVAVFTSGGPVGVSVQTALDAPQIQAAKLNWRVRNGSVTEFTFSGDRIALDMFNGTPHFVGQPEMLTYR
jgi:broad specificity phosphatase PhoE